MNATADPDTLRRPPGYQRRLVPVPDEITTISEIATAVTAGESPDTIADRLGVRGAPAPPTPSWARRATA